MTERATSDLLITYLRTLVLYLILIFTVRMMGKRQIAEMEPAEFVVTMLLANLAAVPMQDNAIPLLSGIFPILIILAMELILAVLSMKFISMRTILCGKPSILISDGVIDQNALRKVRISLDELTEKLREKDVFDLSTLKYAILETNGELTIMLYPQYCPVSAKDMGIAVEDVFLPYTIISDGKLMHNNLQLSGFDKQWLGKELKKMDCKIQDLLLFTVDSSGKTCAIKKEYL